MGEAGWGRMGRDGGGACRGAGGQLPCPGGTPKYLFSNVLGPEEDLSTYLSMSRNSDGGRNSRHARPDKLSKSY